MFLHIRNIRVFKSSNTLDISYPYGCNTRRIPKFRIQTQDDMFLT